MAWTGVQGQWRAWSNLRLREPQPPVAEGDEGLDCLPLTYDLSGSSSTCIVAGLGDAERDSDRK